MSERKKIAIVTGASSGMGRAFVQQIMDKYRRLDEIWVIARHLQKRDVAGTFWDKDRASAAGSFAGSTAEAVKMQALCGGCPGQDFGKCRRNGTDRNI